MRSVSDPAFQALHAGAIGGEFIAGEDHWDFMVLFRYPDWRTRGGEVDREQAYIQIKTNLFEALKL